MGILTGVNDYRRESRGESHSECKRNHHIPVLEKPRRQHSLISHADFHPDKGCAQHGGGNKEPNDLRAVPGKLGSSPLDGQDEAYNGREEGDDAPQVNLPDSVDEPLALRVVIAVYIDKEDDDDDGNETDRDVDPEAPAPVYCLWYCGQLLDTNEQHLPAASPLCSHCRQEHTVVGKDAAQQRSGNAREAKDCAGQAKRHRPLVQGQRVARHDHGARVNTAASHTGDGSAQDEDAGTGSDGADNGPELKDEDAGQEGPFDVEDGIQPAI